MGRRDGVTRTTWPGDTRQTVACPPNGAALRTPYRLLLVATDEDRERLGHARTIGLGCRVISTIEEMPQFVAAFRGLLDGVVADQKLAGDPQLQRLLDQLFTQGGRETAELVDLAPLLDGSTP